MPLKDFWKPMWEWYRQCRAKRLDSEEWAKLNKLHREYCSALQDVVTGATTDIPVETLHKTITEMQKRLQDPSIEDTGFSLTVNRMVHKDACQRCVACGFNTLNDKVGSFPYIQLSSFGPR